MNIKFDLTKFWKEYKKQFGHSPTSIELSGTEKLLSLLQADPQVDGLEWAAFILGTIRNECGGAMMPIKENEDTKRGLVWQKYQSKYWPSGFYGRGYSQLTWEGNYRKFSRAIYGDDRLVQHPDLVMSQEVGYQILATGCVKGMFTKFKLADFLNAKTKDYIHARQIVNGISGEAYKWALRCAGYCAQYESCLKSAMVR
jgi:putative chitinase